MRLNQRYNILGLDVSSRGFKEILAAEGGLSFLLFFLGALFLGTKIAEPDEDKTLFRLGEVAMYGIFVFYFTEAVYVVTGSTLAFPLSLHAVVSWCNFHHRGRDISARPPTCRWGEGQLRG